MSSFKHVRNWTLGLQIPFVIVGLLSWAITSQHGIQYGADSQYLMHNAYDSALHWSWQNSDHQRFGTFPELKRVILRHDPRATVYQGTTAEALSFMRSHPAEKKTATIFVTKDTPSQLTLVGRDGRDVAAQISGDIADKTQTKNLEPDTKSTWSGALPEVLGVEEGIFLLLGLGCGLGVERDERKRKQGSDEEAKDWHKLVPPDDLYGPAQPTKEFSLLNPVCRSHNGVSWFEAVVMDWQGGRWQELEDGEPRKTVTNPDSTTEERVWRGGEWQEYTPLPDSVKAFRAPVDASIEDATAAWVDFCHRVAAQNARVWALRKENDLKRQHLKELTGTPLQEILTPATKVLEGLSVDAGAGA